MQQMKQPSVFTRRVFYIPGYDPHPPRRYRELYRREAARQAAISGYRIAQAPGDGGSTGWRVDASIDGQRCRARFSVLVWSDLVRRSMSGGIAATYLQLLRTAWVYLSSGALWRLGRLRKGPVIAALYPVAMLLAQAVAAVLLGGLAAVLAGAAIGWLGRTPGGGAPVPAPGLRLLTVACGMAVGVLALNWFRAQDGRLFAYYLMHDYAYWARGRGANPAELDARCAAFANEVAAALQGDADEVLIVGHSTGAQLAVQIAAALVRTGRVPGRASDRVPDPASDPARGPAPGPARGPASESAPALSVLTLGQAIPMVTFLPEARALRRDLRDLSAAGNVAWVDVSAPGDGCSFALCDPVAVSGVSPRAQRWPLIVSAAFSQTLDPARWRAMRWRFFTLHFQYLCAFERPNDYDYFRITAGAKTLAERFADRPSSRSRIARALSPYRSVAP